MKKLNELLELAKQEKFDELDRLVAEVVNGFIAGARHEQLIDYGTWGRLKEYAQQLRAGK